MKKKIIIWVVVAIVLFGMLIQLVPLPGRGNNPPVTAEPKWDSPQTRALVQRACFDCHSNETVWPWYSNLAPVSWLLASDVKEGRSHVNFSTWGTYSSEAQSHKLANIAEEVRGADMPPWYYTLVHPEARLSPSERTSVADWAEVASRLQPPRQ